MGHSGNRGAVRCVGSWLCAMAEAGVRVGKVCAQGGCSRQLARCRQVQNGTTAW